LHQEEVAQDAWLEIYGEKGATGEPIPEGKT
jgi:hypothetical protein